MGLTLLKTKVAVECNGCLFQRVWPREANVNSLADVQAKAATWGWTFKGRDLCDKCSKEATDDNR